MEAEKDKKVYKGGGLEVLVPAKEKDFVPVIPRPSLFTAASDEVKEKTQLLPLSPQSTVASLTGSSNSASATVASHSGSERKKGRQARKTRIDIFLPEAEPEEEEQPQPAEDESVPLPAHHYPVEMTNTAYGGFVRCYTNASTSPLLYCRCLSSSVDDDSVIQWMVSQCAMVAPIYVTRFFAPSAVLVQYPDVQTAVKAYQALSGSMYLQFAIEPCSIVSGDEVRAVQAYQELMMNKLRSAHVMQQQPHQQQPHSFDSSPYLYDSAHSTIEPSLSSMDTVSSALPAAASGLTVPSVGSVYTGFFERENDGPGALASSVVDVIDDELDTEQFDFSFLAIGADEFDEARDAHSTSPPASDSPPTPLTVEKASVGVNGTFPSFGSSWNSPSAETPAAASSWASPAHGPSPSTSFSSLPAVSSVFSPMPGSISTPGAPTPLFSPSSPSLKPASVASLTPALDPVLSSPSFGFASPSSPLDSLNRQRRSISSVAPLFSSGSGSLFSSSASTSQSSAESSSSSSSASADVFSLPSFSMFTSLTRSISITDDTSTTSASTATTAPSFFSSASSAAALSSAQLLHVPSSATRASLSSSVSDDDDDEVWNDEKMSRFVLKSDAEDSEEDTGLTTIPTHPRHDSIGDSNDGRVPDSSGRPDEQDVSDEVRTNSDSINAYDQDIDTDFSQRSELPVEEDEPIQYDSRQPQPRYTATNTSPSPRFTRAAYPSAAVPNVMPAHQSSPLHSVPPYTSHPPPSMMHSDAASLAAMYGGGMVHGWNGSVSPSPGYAPYNYNGGYGVPMPPPAQYYPYPQYNANALYMQQQQQQMGIMMGRPQRLLARGVAVPKMPHSMPAGLVGSNPLAGQYTPNAGMATAAYAQQQQQQQQQHQQQQQPQQQHRSGDSEDMSPTDSASVRDDRRRVKRGFVVDLEADFPSLGAVPAASQPSPVSSSAHSPASNHSPNTSATHSTAAYTQSHSSSPSDATHADSNGHSTAGSAEGGAGWTGTLAHKLKGSKEDRRPATANAATTLVAAPPGSPPARQHAISGSAAASTAAAVTSSSSPSSASAASASASASLQLPSSLSRPQSAGKPPQVTGAQSHSVYAATAATVTAVRQAQQQQPSGVQQQQQQRVDPISARKDVRASVDSKAVSAVKPNNKIGGGSAMSEWTEVVSAGKKKNTKR